MPLSELNYKSADGTQIVGYKWEPEDDRGPRAAVQMTHGLGEHAQRYDHVARALNEDPFRRLRPGSPRSRRQRRP